MITYSFTAILSIEEVKLIEKCLGLFKELLKNNWKITIDVGQSISLDSVFDFYSEKRQNDENISLINNIKEKFYSNAKMTSISNF